MRIEFREFKFVTLMLLIPENDTEKKCLDLLGNAAMEKIKLDACLVTDDAFNPYIQCLVPERGLKNGTTTSRSKKSNATR